MSKRERKCAAPLRGTRMRVPWPLETQERGRPGAMFRIERAYGGIEHYIADSVLGRGQVRNVMYMYATHKAVF